MRKEIDHVKVTRSIMFTMNVPKFNWGDVVLIATYLINRMPLRVMYFKSLVELLQGVCSIIVSLEVFSCVCLFDIIDKLDSRALKYVFIRYSTTQKGCRSYHPLS